MNVEIEIPKPADAEELTAPQGQPRDASSDPSAAYKRWCGIADFGVFGLWIAVVGFILGYHEKWADEAQAWLIARDLDLRRIFFYELRYEGTPGLWHLILWIAQHWFHVPYSAFGVIGAVCAAAGTAFILWKSPFPRPLSYLLVFSYFVVYQYAVLARSYNLLPLLVFAAAHFYGDRYRPVPMTAVLILLANVAVHGSLLAAAFGVCYLIEARKEWPNLSVTVRRRYLACIIALMLTFAFLFVILKPTPDVGELTSTGSGLSYSVAQRLASLQSALRYSFLDHWAASAIFLLLAGAWCFRRGKLLTFLLPISLMLLLFVGVHGAPHHAGTIFLAAIAGLWVAWPTVTEVQNFSVGDRRALYGIAGILVCLFCVNIWDAAVAMRKDYLYPYSGSDDAAGYLKQVGADKSTIFGYTYGLAAVQAFFDHNILVNIPTTYYHEGLPLYGSVIDFRELRAAAPEYVVVFSHAPEVEFKIWDPRFRSLGYGLVHFSDGHVFYKSWVQFATSYFIFRRIGPGLGQAPTWSERAR